MDGDGVHRAWEVVAFWCTQSASLCPDTNDNSCNRSSESPSPPPTAHSDSGPRSSTRRADQLVKQTYSTSMTDAATGKINKFHVVAYASKRHPQGDGQNPLPLPHHLPLLANLKVVPGIWPEWEQRRDSDPATGSKKPIHVEALIAPINTTGAPGGPPYSAFGPGPSGVPQYQQRPMSGPRPRTPPNGMGHQMNAAAASSGSMDRYHPYSRNRPPPFPGINEYPPRRTSLPAPHTAPCYAAYPPYQNIAPDYREPPYPDLPYPQSAPPSGPLSALPPQVPPPPHAYPSGYVADRYDPYNRPGFSMRSPPFYARPPLGADTGMPLYGTGGEVAGMASRRDPEQGISPISAVSPITSSSSRSPRLSMSTLLSSDVPTGQGYAPGPASSALTLPPLRMALDGNQLPPKVISTTTSPASHALPLGNYTTNYPTKAPEVLNGYGYQNPSMQKMKYERAD